MRRLPCGLVSRTLLLVVWLTGTGCVPPADSKLADAAGGAMRANIPIDTGGRRHFRSDLTDPDANHTDLSLAATGTQSRDHVAVRVEFLNRSSRAVTWDREFVAFLHWNLVGDQDRDLETRDLDPPPRPTEKEFNGRFANLGPNESVAHEFVLTSPFREFTYSVAFGPQGHSVLGGEAMSELVVPPTVKGLHLWIWYDTSMRGAEGCFGKWFGHDPRALNFPNQRFVSNELVIRF